MKIYILIMFLFISSCIQRVYSQNKSTAKCSFLLTNNYGDTINNAIVRVFGITGESVKPIDSTNNYVFPVALHGKYCVEIIAKNHAEYKKSIYIDVNNKIENVFLTKLDVLRKYSLLIDSTFCLKKDTLNDIRKIFDQNKNAKSCFVSFCFQNNDVNFVLNTIKCFLDIVSSNMLIVGKEMDLLIDVSDKIDKDSIIVKFIE